MSRHNWHIQIVTIGLLIVLFSTAMSHGSAALAKTIFHATHNTHASPGSLGTLHPGVAVVSIEPYMPYVGAQNGKLTGLDGDIMTALAQRLHLKVQIFQSDFPGQLAAVQSHRVDVAIGSIGWTKERAKVGLFTDPTYYAPTVVSERKGQNITRLDQMAGKTVCTITGYLYIPALQDIPGATLRTYPTSANMYEDISNGRCDVGFSDALLNIYMALHSPHFHLTFKYLTPPTARDVAAHPLYSRFEKAELCFYIPPQEPQFERALTAGIRAFYKSGLEARLLKKWGADPVSWLQPPPLVAKDRIGVDRPTGWTPPLWKP